MIMAKRTTNNPGFTLVELMVTILISSIVLLGIGGVIADSHKGYNRMFTRIHGAIVNDAYFARLRFDKVCRQARAGSATVDASVPSLRVLYYSIPNYSSDPDQEPDSYATFFLDGTYPAPLMLARGTYDPNTEAYTQTSTETVAGNVTELQFSAPFDGKSVQMVMTLSDNNHSMTVTCGSIMHN